MGYHCKPYAAEEILQLATKAVNDYNKLRNLESLISVVANISISETHLNSLLQNILDQLAFYIGSDEAVIGKLLGSNEYQQLFSIGSVEKQINVQKLAAVISAGDFTAHEVVQVDELVFVRLDDYSLFAVLNKNQHLKTEKIYLLKLFVQNAAKAIKNVQLHEELIHKERLSAVGKALSMLMHDLRSPINNISALTTILREEGVKSQWLDMIDVCSVQATEIFDDFLDYIKETPLILQKTPVDILIKSGVSMAEGRKGFEDI